MTVYVDDVAHPFKGMLMCHMWADTEEELFAMADRIGVQRKWVQGHQTSIGKARNVDWVHFDISLGKKALAIEYGAIMTDPYGPLEHCARMDMKSNLHWVREEGERKLAKIERRRVMV